MYINATLLLQAIHFGFAYCLLRFFLYRPVVAIIKQDQNERKQIRDEINLKQIKITKYKQLAATVLKEAQLSASQKKPGIKVEYPFSIEHVQTVQHVPDTTVKKLADDMSHIIVENINHVP